MNSLEAAYNQAVDMLKKGRSKQEALLKFAEFKNELAPLLDISFSLLSLPKNSPPQPAMQRKYALVPSKGFWLTWIHVSKFAGVSMSLMLLLSAFTVTGYATLKSAPGQTLFQVKKSAEKLQLVLAYNQNQKANIQLQITQSRLNDAKQIFSDPNSNVEQEKAALSELSDQTSNAVAVVNTVAKNDPASDKNHPLVNSLESIAKEQQSLLSKIKPDSEIKIEANTALLSLNKNSAKISEIKSLVATASNDQALTTLKTNATSSPESSVKGASTEIATSTNQTATGSANTVLKKATDHDTDKSIETQNSSSTAASVKADPATAIGAFILEDPAPQYSPN